MFGSQGKSMQKKNTRTENGQHIQVWLQLQWAPTNEHICWILFISTISLLFHNASVLIPICICIRARVSSYIHICMGGTTNDFNFIFLYIYWSAIPVVILFMHDFFLTNSVNSTHCVLFICNKLTFTYQNLQLSSTFVFCYDFHYHFCCHHCHLHDSPRKNENRSSEEKGVKLKKRGETIPDQGYISIWMIYAKIHLNRL